MSHSDCVTTGVGIISAKGLAQVRLQEKDGAIDMAHCSTLPKKKEVHDECGSSIIYSVRTMTKIGAEVSLIQ